MSFHDFGQEAKASHPDSRTVVSRRIQLDALGPPLQTVSLLSLFVIYYQDLKVQTFPSMPDSDTGSDYCGLRISERFWNIAFRYTGSYSYRTCGSP